MNQSSLSFLALLFLTASAQALAIDTKKCSEDEHYPVINKSELKKVIESKSAWIVDVNGEDSFQKAHVTGAIHFDSHKADFARQLPKKKDTLIVAYCGGPQCQAWLKAAKEACNLGYTNIKHYKDGIKGWVKSDS